MQVIPLLGVFPEDPWIAGFENGGAWCVWGGALRLRLRCASVVDLDAQEAEFKSGRNRKQHVLVHAFTAGASYFYFGGGRCTLGCRLLR